MLYLHAYQSYLWNHVATRRLADLGDKAPVVGVCLYIRVLVSLVTTTHACTCTVFMSVNIPLSLPCIR